MEDGLVVAMARLIPAVHQTGIDEVRWTHTDADVLGCQHCGVSVAHRYLIGVAGDVLVVLEEHGEGERRCHESRRILALGYNLQILELVVESVQVMEDPIMMIVSSHDGIQPLVGNLALGIHLQIR